MFANKLHIYTVVQIIMGLAMLGLLVGCSPPKRPSEDTVKRLAKQSDKIRVRAENVYASKIDKVDILEWGKYNKEEKYFAVKIRVIGNKRFMGNNYGRINKVLDCKVYKDDFGDWQIE